MGIPAPGGMKSRRIGCPEFREGVHYRASNPNTGEILESNDVAAILRRITGMLLPGDRWTLECWESDVG